MELKPYQNRVLSDLRLFIEYVKKFHRVDLAFSEYWKEKLAPIEFLYGTGIEPYKNNVPKVPNVCIKVPTAGGKTFIACNSLKIIFDALLTQTKSVLWLVPSVSILDQTIKNLSNPSHPYRQKINQQFLGRVEVYTKDKILNGAGFNPTSVQEQLNIIVMSFDSFRSKKKEDRKMYQENGNLASFANLNSSAELLSNMDETALINVIRKLHPVVIVDESHNAETELSIEMLQNVNPLFILDLTATPRKYSNIISFVNAGELKSENMIKLPVIVSNYRDKTDVVHSALQLQRKLEQFAKEQEKETNKYIRPIILFQAQSKKNNSEEQTTFEKLKQKLIDAKIPSEQIKIKTANINEIKGMDLLSKNCPVRFIITVNALKEGWDCPFAYILASLADRSSEVDVEQIVGRILRQPYTSNYTNDMLNSSYIMVSSEKFLSTLDKIVLGLNKAGFSRKDYRVVEAVLDDSKNESIQEKFDFKTKEQSNLDEIDPTRISENSDDTSSVDPIEKKVMEESQKFQSLTNGKSNYTQNKIIPIELMEKVKMIQAKDIYLNRIIDLKLPKFYMKENVGLFGSGEILLEKRALLSGFKLSQSDTKINFQETIHSEIYKVDTTQIRNDEYTIEYQRLDKDAEERFKQFILTKPRKGQLQELIAVMKQLLGDMNPIQDYELDKYLLHIFETFSPEQIEDCLEKRYSYMEKIKHKINDLSSNYGKRMFHDFLKTNKIFLKMDYQIPIHQTASDAMISGITKSLYEKEVKMNDFEKRVINEIANLPNVICWTKNLEKKGFFINAHINHYPDFIVFLKSGNILIVESKGDDRDNSDSMTKLELGNSWATQAGFQYKYFMIFDKNSMKDAYSLDHALNLIRDL